MGEVVAAGRARLRQTVSLSIQALPTDGTKRRGNVIGLVSTPRVSSGRGPVASHAAAATKILAALASVCLLAACAQTTYLSDFCLHAEPLRPNSAAWEAADRIFREQIVKLNEKGVELCGWEP